MLEFTKTKGEGHDCPSVRSLHTSQCACVADSKKLGPQGTRLWTSFLSMRRQIEFLNEFQLEHIDLSYLIEWEKDGELERQWKNFCAYPTALVNRNQPIGVTEGLNYKNILGRSFNRYITNRLNHNNLLRCKTDTERSNFMFTVTTILNWKDTALPVGDEFKEKEMEKHKAALGAFCEKKVDEKFKKSLDLLLTELIGEPTWIYTPTVVPSPNFSFNSCVGGSRRGKGAAGCLCKKYGITKNVKLIQNDELGFRIIEDISWVEVDMTAVAKRPRATYIQLCEPCKIRGISTEEPEANLMCIAFNQAITPILKKHKMFTALERPVEGKDVRNIFERPVILSGDYKGATDNISGRHSQYVLRRLCWWMGGWFEENVEQLVNSLCNHNIYYPDGSIVEQNNGQLMGCGASFPILSLINAAINYEFIVFEEMGKSLSDNLPLYSELDMLIHGDDVLLGLFGENTPERLRSWETTVSKVGLNSSLGKTIISSYFGSFCSLYWIKSLRNDGEIKRIRDQLWVDGTDFTYNKLQVAYEPVRVPYLRLNFIFGQERVDGTGNMLGSEEEYRGASFGDKLKLVADESPLRYSAYLKEFKYFQKKALSEFKGCIHLPECFGGLGIPKYFDFSDKERRVATFVNDKYQILKQKGFIRAWQTGLDNKCVDALSDAKNSHLLWLGWTEEPRSFYENESYVEPTFPFSLRDYLHYPVNLTRKIPERKLLRRCLETLANNFIGPLLSSNFIHYTEANNCIGDIWTPPIEGPDSHYEYTQTNLMHTSHEAIYAGL